MKVISEKSLSTSLLYYNCCYYIKNERLLGLAIYTLYDLIADIIY